MIEVIAVLLACILLLYILYSCLANYCARRKVIREKRERRFLTEVETRMGRSQMDKPKLAIEMAPSAPRPGGATDCIRVHVPDYQLENPNNSTTDRDIWALNSS